MKELASAALLAWTVGCSSEAEPGRQSANVALEESVDHSRLGVPCESSSQCPSGRCAVYAIAGERLNRCITVDDPCALVTCKEGDSCTVYESSPVQVACSETLEGSR